MSARAANRGTAAPRPSRALFPRGEASRQGPKHWPPLGAEDSLGGSFKIPQRVGRPFCLGHLLGFVRAGDVVFAEILRRGHLPPTPGVRGKGSGPRGAGPVGGCGGWG